MTGDTTIEFAARLDRALDYLAARRAEPTEQKKVNDEKRALDPLTVARIAFWGFALVFTVGGLILMVFHWSGRYPIPMGVPTWTAAGLIVSVLCESKAQSAQHDRRLRDVQGELVVQARALPAAVLAQARELLLAAEHQRLRHEAATKDLQEDTNIAVRHMGERLGAIEDCLVQLCEIAETAIVKADAVAFVDERSEAEGDKRTGHLGSLVQFPAQKRPPASHKDDHS